LTGPLEAKVDLTPGFLGTAGPVVAGAVLEDRGFLDANGEALDEVVVADEAGLDVAAFLAAVAAVVRLANGAREAVVAGLVVEEAVGAAGFVVVLDDKGALVAVVPFCLAVVVVLAGEAVRVTVDLTAVVGAAFFSATGLVVAGVGLFWVMGDALAAVGAGLGVGPVLVVDVPVAVVLAPVAVVLVVLVVEPGAGLAVLVAVEDAAGLLVGVALLVVAEEGLDEVVEGTAGFLVAPAPALAPVVLGVVDLDELPTDALQGHEPLAAGAALGAVLGAETGLELVGLAAGADLSPGFLAGPVDPATGFLAFGLLATAAAVAPAAAAVAAAAAMTATTSLVSLFCVLQV